MLQYRWISSNNHIKSLETNDFQANNVLDNIHLVRQISCLSSQLAVYQFCLNCEAMRKEDVIKSWYPNEVLSDDEALMTPHIHGIFFRTLTRWEKGKLSKRIKKYFPQSRIRPFVVRPQYDLESAIQYSFKALFGGKRTFMRRNLTIGLKNTNMTYKAVYAKQKFEIHCGTITTKKALIMRAFLVVKSDIK